jgi:hypothetical protein
MNMLKMKLVAANRLGRATVLAAEFSPLFDLISDLVGGGHFALGLTRQRFSSV